MPTMTFFSEFDFDELEVLLSVNELLPFCDVYREYFRPHIIAIFDVYL